MREVASWLVPPIVLIVVVLVSFRRKSADGKKRYQYDRSFEGELTDRQPSYPDEPF